MSKRTADSQGGSERYGDYSDQPSMNSTSTSQRATAAQMAARKIATAKSSVRGGRSRSNTPGANPFASVPVQNQVQPAAQTMSFQPSTNSFTFSAGPGAPSAPSFSSNSVFNQQSAGVGANGGAQSQQNGNIFGNTAATFGAGAVAGATPQQNGFGSGTTAFGINQNNSSAPNGDNTIQPSKIFSFGQNAHSNNNPPLSSFGSFGGNQPAQPSFSSFGQSQTQQNGTKPALFSFGASNNENKSQESQLGSFATANTSQSQQISQTPATSFGASASQPQPNGGTSLFGANAPASKPVATAAPFGSFASSTPAKANGEQSTNSFQAASQTPSSSMPAENGQKAVGLFGSQATPARSESPSVFSNVGQKAITPGMFTNNTASTAAQTPTTGLFNQGNGATAQFSQTSSMFGAQGVASSSKPQTGFFSFGAPAQPSQPSQQDEGSTTAFGSNNQAQDTSMQTPSSTPQKQTGFDPTASAAPSTAFKPAASAPDTAQQPNLFQFASSAAPSTGTSQAEPTAPSNGKSLLDRMSRDGGAVFAQQKPSSTSMFGAKDAPASISNPNKQTTSATTSSSRATELCMSLSAKESFKELNEGVKAHLQSQDPMADWTAILEVYLLAAAKLRGDQSQHKHTGAAPESALSKAAGAPTNARDLSKTAPSYLGMKRSGPGASAADDDDDDAHSPSPEKRARTAENTDYPILPNQASTTSKLFQSVYSSDARSSSDNFGTGAGASSESMEVGSPHFGPPKSLLDSAREDKARAQAQSAKSAGFTPSTAGFTPTTTRFTSSTTGFKPSTSTSDSGSAPQPTFTASTSGFTPSTSGFKPITSTASSDSTAQPAPSTLFGANASGGFTPSLPKNDSSSQSANASALGFVPTGVSAPATGSTGGGFLAAFGQRAEKQQASDREKRRAEDYDSDEDTEETWAARDKAEQEAKRQKILDAAKSSTGFVFNVSKPGDTNSYVPNKLSIASEASRSPSTGGPTPQVIGPSNSNLFSTQGSSGQPAKKAIFDTKAAGTTSAAPSLFSNLTPTSDASATSKNDAEKAQGTGDNTWKPSTPLKFGATSNSFGSATPAAAPPKTSLFGSTFGSASKDDTPLASAPTLSHLNAPSVKSSLNFDFGASSANGSRAGTPATITTDGDGASTAGDAEAGDEAAPPEPQVEDETGLREEEKREEDVLLTVSKSKAMKWVKNKRDPETGDVKPGWLERGRGPLYILRHKVTGKTRVILKVPPFGKACMNFAPVKGLQYVCVSAKLVKGPFLDHLDTTHAEEPKMSDWLIQVGKPEDAKEIARLLSEAAADA